VKTLDKLDARIPSWDLSDLRERTCPICGSAGRPRFVRPDRLTVRECLECGTWFVSPAPTDAQLTAFYRQYDLTHRRDPPVPGAEWAKSLKDMDPLSDFRFQEMLSMIDLEGKRCLDVGFGRGYFLASYRRLGAHAAGLELDPDAIRMAKEHLGITDVKQATLLDLDDHDRYDVITMIDLIEHPLHPLETLEKAARLLNPGGLIVIWTPNASFASEEEPVLFRVDLEHMQYFSCATCAHVANRLGLEIVHLENVGRPHLDGIERLPERSRARAPWMRRIAKLVPGYGAVRRLREAVSQSDLRLGHYHLFCILRRAGAA
jgi:2-polyprenyl-3-methyl-5-hydroxy-6-metoxy-1,4-benzoquinol methylase